MFAPAHTPRDLYQEVTDRILTALEQGVPPWVQPWNAALTLPRNGVTGRPYSGINTLLLWLAAAEGGYRSPDWFTYRAAAQAGGQVRKGEKGTLVTFWTTFIPVEDRTAGADAQTMPMGDDPRRVPVLKHFIVFNRAQVDGLADEPAEPVTPAEPMTAEQVAQDVGGGHHGGGAKSCLSSGHGSDFPSTTEHLYHPGRLREHLAP